jgi:hypothetical protein
MTIAFVQEAHDYAFATRAPLNLAYGSNVTLGDLLLAFVDSNAALGTMTVTDTRSNTWNLLTAFGGGYGAGGSCALFYAIANATGSCTVTFSRVANGNITQCIGQIAEFSGTALASVLDGSAVSNTGNSSSPSATITTTGPNELVVAAVSPTGGTTDTGSTGWTQMGTGGYGMVYAVKAAAGSQTPTFTGSGSGTWGTAAAAFQPLASARQRTIAGAGA